MGENYAAMVKVSEEMLAQEPGMTMKVTRERLLDMFAMDILPKIVDSGIHHVIKLDLYRANLEDYLMLGVTTFGMKCYLGDVEYKSVSIPVIEDSQFDKFVPACMWCGAIFHEDKRGCCSACGAPPNNNFVEANNG